MNFRAVITPNERITPQTWWGMAAAWFVLSLAYWSLFRPEIFPSPLEVLQAFPSLWSEQGLGQQLVSSFTVNFEAILLSTIISLGLAYVSTVPAAQSIVLSVSKLRFVSPAVFLFVAILATSSGHQLKLSILTLGITVFFVTTMMGVVASIPLERFDHARTLRMSEWQTVWYVIIMGTKAEAIDALRDNAAMGWAMLTMVEGFVRSEGGVGVLILDQDKHLNLANVYATAAAMIFVGLTQDYVIGFVKQIACPERTK